LRDSSHGGGAISGFIDFSLDGGQSDLEGISLFARSLDNGELYSYNFGKETGEFKITNIPYGTYEVIGQKIGIDNAISEIITIDTLNNQIENIIITFNVTDVEDDEINVPEDIELYPNYPNPFNNSTVIKYAIPVEGLVTLTIYNILGEEVVQLVNETKQVGNYAVFFNAAGLPSGIYFYRLHSGSLVVTKKMVLMK